MEATEMRNVAEKIYKIQMAAIRVYEANESYQDAYKAHNEQPYDWTHKDQEGNDRWMALTEDMNKKEGQLKKAVNSFFRAVDEPQLVQNWDLGLSAIFAYNKYIDEIRLFGRTNPIPSLSLNSFKACRY